MKSESSSGGLKFEMNLIVIKRTDFKIEKQGGNGRDERSEKSHWRNQIGV